MMTECQVRPERLLRPWARNTIVTALVIMVFAFVTTVSRQRYMRSVLHRVVARARAENGLATIVRAILEYELRIGHLPFGETDTSAVKHDGPVSSWRIAILPFLGENALHDRVVADVSGITPRYYDAPSVFIPQLADSNANRTLTSVFAVRVSRTFGEELLHCLNGRTVDNPYDRADTTDIITDAYTFVVHSSITTEIWTQGSIITDEKKVKRLLQDDFVAQDLRGNVWYCEDGIVRLLVKKGQVNMTEGSADE